MLNLQAGCAKGYPQGEFSFGRDADSAGFAAAVDDCVGQIVESALVFYSVNIIHVKIPLSVVILFPDFLL